MTTPRASIAETHVSWVFFVGDRAYKLKKPVRFGFLDFTSREARELACRQEVELNRRLAPDVYLGVLDVYDGTRIRDHLVEMRRMPTDRRLSTLLQDGAVRDEDIVSLASVLARFHLQAPVVTAPPLADLWERSFTQTAPFVGTTLPPSDQEAVEDLARRYVIGRARLLAGREAAGFIRDGHGDLLAEDIFLLADGPRVLDCIEFDDELRAGDVVGDIAFLAMDIERLGAPDIAARLVAEWAALVDSSFPASLLHQYVAYRAHIRCKVACLRAEQGDETAAQRAAAHLALARRHLEAGAVRFVLVGGAPGAGKSTLSEQLAPRLEAVILRSDEVRAELGFHESVRYRPDAKSRVYDEMLERARHHLSNGRSVVADATWGSATHRDSARQVARDTVSDLSELRCDIESRVAAERLRSRVVRYGSEATPGVAETLMVEADPWPEATAISTARPPEDAIASALAIVGR